MSLALNGNSLENRTFRFKVQDPSQVGVARRYAVGLADLCKFDEGQKGKLGIVITELCTNLLNHANGGEILLKVCHENSTSSIETLCIDRGPGMTNLSLCMSDGYSQGSTPGNGLGAIKRLSDLFDIYTIENQGTVVLSIINSQPGMAFQPKMMKLGIICLPIEGEQECGDSWLYHLEQDKLQVIVADGLGHGLLAHQASQEALSTYSQHRDESLPLRMTQIHQSLRSTRGAAVSMADLDFNQKKLDFIGVGNVRCLLMENGKMRTLVCQSGTAGLQIRQAKVFSAEWNSESLLIIHSDGLATRWDLNQYQGITSRHPSLIAAVLYRDFCRGTDDVTVFVGGFQ